jgi:predicted peroxiredoxin
MRISILISDDVPWASSLACEWAAEGDAITVVLLDTAAAAARAGSADQPLLDDLLRAGVAVFVEERALQRRVLDPSALVDGVKVMRLDELADLLAEDSDKAVWL